MTGIGASAIEVLPATSANLDGSPRLDLLRIDFQRLHVLSLGGFCDSCLPPAYPTVSRHPWPDPAGLGLARGKDSRIYAGWCALGIDFCVYFAGSTEQHSLAIATDIASPAGVAHHPVE